MKKGNRVLWFGIGFALVLLCICGLGSLLLLGKAWKPIIGLTPTPEMSGGTLDDLFRRQEGMTSLQQEAFLKATIGQQVYGRVTVDDVEEDGTLSAHFGPWHRVVIEGLPHEKVSSVTRGQVVAVGGTVDRWDWMGMTLYLDLAVIE